MCACTVPNAEGSLRDGLKKFMLDMCLIKFSCEIKNTVISTILEFLILIRLLIRHIQW